MSTTLMLDLLQLLKEFNRKERFYLIGVALGNPEFRLSEGFREALGQALGLSVPEDAFAAMDFHLDWLAASLHLATNCGHPGPYWRDAHVVTATQQDVDLLVAYQGKEGCHFIMLEAKGVTAYSNRQFHCKVKRLKAIFESPEAQAARAIPRFALVSPRPSRGLNYECCPPWMLKPDGKVAWVQLPLPTTLKKVVRCHLDCTVSDQGDYWMVIPELPRQ